MLQATSWVSGKEGRVDSSTHIAAEESPRSKVVAMPTTPEGTEISPDGRTARRCDMADSHDQAETGGAGVGFVIGLLLGTVLGAGLGMLLAPKAGADLRCEIRRRGREMGQKAADRYREAGDTASSWVEQGRETLDRVRSAVSSGAEEVRRFAARRPGEQASGPTAKNPPSDVLTGKDG